MNLESQLQSKIAKLRKEYLKLVHQIRVNEKQLRSLTDSKQIEKKKRKISNLYSTLEKVKTEGLQAKTSFDKLIETRRSLNNELKTQSMLLSEFLNKGYNPNDLEQVNEVNQLVLNIQEIEHKLEQLNTKS